MTLHLILLGLVPQNFQLQQNPTALCQRGVIWHFCEEIVNNYRVARSYITTGTTPELLQHFIHDDDLLMAHTLMQSHSIQTHKQVSIHNLQFCLNKRRDTDWNFHSNIISILVIDKRKIMLCFPVTVFYFQIKTHFFS